MIYMLILKVTLKSISMFSFNITLQNNFKNTIKISQSYLFWTGNFWTEFEHQPSEKFRTPTIRNRMIVKLK
jgi:hypothetical protein